MKTIKAIMVLVFILSSTTGQAQLLKKLGKAAERAAERTVERRVEQETSKKTDQALDSVFDKKKKKKDRRKKKKRKKSKNKSEEIDSQESNNMEDTAPTYDIKRASDFVPGNVVIFKDNFTKDQQGDFPVAWDTNGGGEITLINSEKWMRLGGRSTYIPMTKETLPENYTVEFDLLTSGLDGKTSSQAFISLLLEDNTGFTKAKDWCVVELSPCQFIGNQGVIEKVENGKRQLRNQVGKDYRNTINGKSHISIAVNKTRMRVWLNENKLIDIPRLVPAKANVFKIAVRGLRDEAGKDDVFIANFSLAKTGEDNRSKLITEGRLTTNAILFESGSATLKSESYPTIREIAKVLEDNPNVQIKIIGHTDSDGPEGGNDTLSQKRAEAVKAAMQNAYGIDSVRMQTDGMGERQPIATNNSPQGKAQNRRVEFIKI